MKNLLLLFSFLVGVLLPSHSQIATRDSQKEILTADSESLLKTVQSITPTEDLLPQPQALSATATDIIYGSLIHDRNWTGDGIYSFPAVSNASLTLRSPSFWEYKMISGINYYGTYYALSDPWGGAFMSYDIDTWAENPGYGYMPTDNSHIALDMTFDPVSRTAFGIMVSNSSEETDRLCRINLRNGIVTYIGQIPYMVTLAANHAGELYGIGLDGYLYSINKTNASNQRIGSGLGVNPSIFSQSMSFSKNGTLYWTAVLTSGNTALYTIDTTTGVATLVHNFPYQEQFTAIFVISSLTPQRPTELAVNISNESHTSGVISFKIPTTDVSGNNLGGTLTGKIIITKPLGEEQVIDLSGLTQGALYQHSEIVFQEGVNTVDVFIENEHGDSFISSTKTFSGIDVPGAVGNLTAVEVPKGKVTLSWDAPTTGYNNGYFDVAELKYRIYRNNIVIESDYTSTTYIDNNTEEETATYEYVVVPYTAAGECSENTPVQIIIFFPVLTPYLETFDTEADFNLWTVININEGTTWQYQDFSQYARYSYDENLFGDDWLISPSIRLFAGQEYLLSYEASTNYSPEDFKVTLGTSANHTDHTIVLNTHESFNELEPQVLTKTFSVDTDGDYHIGFYVYSAPFMWDLNIDNISITDVVNDMAPGTVTNLQITPAAEGELSAELKFNAPTKTASGANLSNITKIEVYANNSLAPDHIVNNPTLGVEITWTDNSPKNGFNTYIIKAYNTSGIGASISEKAFIGEDAPTMITNLTINNINGDAVVSWDAPTTGLNGGYVNPNNVSYRIERNNGIVIDEEIDIFMTNIKGATTYTDNTVATSHLNSDTINVFAHYIVTPFSETGNGASSKTNTLIFGRPHPLPFVESFYSSTSAFTYAEWQYNTTLGSGWWLTTYGEGMSSEDGKPGSGFFEPYGGHAEARLISPLINIKNTNAPVFSFWAYLNDTNNASDCLQLEISQNAGETYEAVGDPIYIRAENTGWAHFQYSLGEYTESDFFSIAIKASASNIVYIDNLTIYAPLEHDLSISGISAPDVCKIDETAKYSASISNNTSNNVAGSDYTLGLYKDGELLYTKEGAGLAAGEGIDIEFEVTPSYLDAETYNSYQIILVYEDDEDLSNNSSEIIETYVPSSHYLMINDLAASSSNSSINLSWTEASTIVGSQSEYITEDFESYTSFIIENIGDWTLIAGDQGETLALSREYPHQFEPSAYQVFNFRAIGLNSSEYSTISGNQVLMQFAGADLLESHDWLISPELSGNTQTISFHARSIAPTDQQRITVYYSLSGTEITDFVPLSSSATNFRLPYQWERYSYKLPEGTKHFAIETTFSTFALCIDDISFAKKSIGTGNFDFLGYNIYRDDVKITSAPTGETSFADTNVENGKTYTYSISSVYEQGESPKSNVVSCTFEGHTGIFDNHISNINVYTKDKAIVIESATGNDVSVFTVDGVKAVQKHADSNNLVIDAQTGVYIVKVGSYTTKVVVR